MLPLSIYAFIERPAVITALDIIAKYAERWFRVTFDIPPSCYDTFKCIRGRLPALEYISLGICAQTSEECNALDIFSIAPRLHTVHLTDFFEFTLPTNQVTTLCMENGDADECVNALLLYPHAVKCDFLFVLAHHLHTPLPQVFASQLESFNITLVNICDLASIFNALTIPAARELICRGPILRDPMKFPHAHFIRLISRSSCSLQILALEDFDISQDNDFIECLRAVPLLRELSLSHLNITQETFRMLHIQQLHCTE
jgi:hypothetical protein